MPPTIDLSRRRTVERVCRHIDANLEGELTLAALGAYAGWSPAHLQRVFKAVLGITPRQYAAARRVEKLKSGLKSDRSVTAAMLEAGYGSSSRLYERAADHLGMTPGRYKRGGRGLTVRYAVAPSGLGLVLLAGTERGIAMLSLGDDEGGLRAALRAEFPAAVIEPDDATLRPWLDAVLQYLDGQTRALDLPLDVQATAFQSRVWQELMKIPRGETRTYTQVAEALGQPTAARAVARACATNPASLVIPCHRVVREDGHLAGYRWGLGRKQKLLELEQAADGEQAKEGDK